MFQSSALITMGDVSVGQIDFHVSNSIESENRACTEAVKELANQNTAFVRGRRKFPKKARNMGCCTRPSKNLRKTWVFLFSQQGFLKRDMPAVIRYARRSAVCK